jgi:SAM-dependent methyltransferase
MTDPFYEGRDLEILADMPNYYDWIMDALSPYVRGHVIEYGAGAGTVSARLAPLADKLTLVELSANLIAPLSARFGNNPKVSVVRESLEEHSGHLAAETADTVVMVNVLEHIEDDRDALTHLLRILRPGGHLLLFVPALQGLMSKLDLMHGHFRRYHRPDLIAKVEEAGGEVVLARYFDCIGVIPWLVLNKLMGSTTFNPLLVSMNDKFVVPASRMFERVISPPFGKNLILAMRKPPLLP